MADTYANPKLEKLLKKDAAARKRQAAALVKLYTRTAINMLRPTIQRFDLKNAALTPWIVFEKIETPVLEKMAARRYDKKLFWILFGISCFLFAAGIVGSVLLCLPYGPLEDSWSHYNYITKSTTYYHDFGVVWFLALCIPVTVLLTGVAIFLAFLLGKPQFKRLNPIITAELDARGQAAPTEATREAEHQEGDDELQRLLLFEED